MILAIGSKERERERKRQIKKEKERNKEKQLLRQLKCTRYLLCS